MNWGAITRLQRPLRVEFYTQDTFPVTFDCVSKRLDCIGNCPQCPLYLHKGKVDCTKLIYDYISKNIPLPASYKIKGEYPKVINGGILEEFERNNK